MVRLLDIINVEDGLSMQRDTGGADGAITYLTFKRQNLNVIKIIFPDSKCI